MTETGYGEGGYAWTLAETPSAPELTRAGSTSLRVVPGVDGNPDNTEYAICNETAGLWLASDGTMSTAPVWLTGSEWGTVIATGLFPAREYTFRSKARNRAGIETELGPRSSLTTHDCAETGFGVGITVLKASSTITPPSFMATLTPSIRLAGKSLIDFGFQADRIGGLELPRVVPDEELVPGDHTWQVRDEYFAMKRIVLEGHIHGVSPDDLRLRIAYLKSFLATFEGNPWRSRSPVTLERSDMGDRHWKVYYESLDQVEILGKRDLSSSAKLRVTMKCPLPFALSNDIVRTVFAPAAGEFRALDLGNAPSDAVYVIRGPSENPAFSVGDMIFHCDFSGGLSFTDVENAESAGIYSPATNESSAWRTTETGEGILVTGSNTVSYTATGNRTDGAWVVVIEPQWRSSSKNTDVVVLEHRYDADNLVRLYWDCSAQAWVFCKRAGGAQAEVGSSFQAFTAGTRIVLGITWDSTNAGGMKIYVDGIQEGVGGDITALHQAPQSLTLHDGDGAQQPDAVFALAAGWSRMLSADEMLKAANDVENIANHNTTIQYTGMLDAGDALTIDSAHRTAEFFDVSAGTRTNALGSLTGEIPVLTPGRRRTATDRTQTMIHCRTAMGGMEVRYRRRYL